MMNNSISEKICGIYIIEAISGNINKIGWKYVGQSDNILNRLHVHKRDLKNNKHENPKLQKYVNKYGIKSLLFYTLIKCSKNELNFNEKFWIKCFDSKNNGFNQTWGGENPPIRKRGGILKNYITGEIIKFNSIINFCKKYKVLNSSISNLLSKRHKFHKNWCLPETNIKIKEYRFVDPNGILHIVNNMNKLAKEYNITSSAFRRLYFNEIKSYKGWRKYNNDNDLIKFEKKQFKFISPNGKLIIIDNLNKFAKENNLNHGCLRAVSRGKYKNHNGWRKYNNDNNKLIPSNGKEYIFVNPGGEIIKTKSIKTLAEKYNLNRYCLCQVISNHIKQHKGWRKYNEMEKISKYIPKTYKFISPDGKIYITENLRQFAISNNLNSGHLSQVYIGNKKQYRGWVKYKE